MPDPSSGEYAVSFPRGGAQVGKWLFDFEDAEITSVASLLEFLESQVRFSPSSRTPINFLGSLRGKGVRSPHCKEDSFRGCRSRGFVKAVFARSAEGKAIVAARGGGTQQEPVAVGGIKWAKHLKVVFIGEGGCGKTCLLEAVVHGVHTPAYLPTVFDNYQVNFSVDDRKYLVTMWDTAGQEDYDRLRPLAFPRADVIVLCYAIDKPSTLKSLQEKFHPQMSHHCPSVPFIVAVSIFEICVALCKASPGLKSDKRTSETTGSSVSTSAGKELADAIGAVAFQECSASAKEGLDAVLEQLVRATTAKSTSKKKNKKGR